MFEIGDKVKINPNWLEIEDPDCIKMKHWKKIGVIDFINSRIGIVMEVKRKSFNVYDLDLGKGMAFKGSWLKEE